MYISVSGVNGTNTISSLPLLFERTGPNNNFVLRRFFSRNANYIQCCHQAECVSVRRRSQESWNKMLHPSIFRSFEIRKGWIYGKIQINDKWTLKAHKLFNIIQWLILCKCPCWGRPTCTGTWSKMGRTFATWWHLKKNLYDNNAKV